MRRQVIVAVTALLCGLPTTDGYATGSATIRGTHADTPPCTTTDRLMDFVRSRNPALDPRFDSIAEYYRGHGINLGVRWDWAFFQMLIETNYLTFEQPNGMPGNVRSHQNNFAGIGSTGPGVPGESFGSPEDGVRAHLQHLLVYAGDTVTNPVAVRTGQIQSWIVPWARGLGRPVTFADMTTRWSPHDPGYAGDIADTADRFTAFCRCASYADEAMSQVQTGLDSDCGLFGATWSNDYNVHFQWCLTTASPSQLEQGRLVREQGLSRCMAECQTIVGRWTWWTGTGVDFFADNRWQAADSDTGGTWRCRRDDSGVLIFVIAPDDGGWQDTVALQEDGSLWGTNQAGGIVGGTRDAPERPDCPPGYNPYGCL